MEVVPFLKVSVLEEIQTYYHVVSLHKIVVEQMYHLLLLHELLSEVVLLQGMFQKVKLLLSDAIKEEIIVFLVLTVIDHVLRRQFLLVDITKDVEYVSIAPREITRVKLNPPT